MGATPLVLFSVREVKYVRSETECLYKSAGIEPGPHWWEASALITVASLLPSPFVIQ